MAKFQVTMKDPDGSYESITDAAKEMVAAVQGIDEEEREALMDNRVKKLNEFISKWMEYGEYITVEFDTDAGTATVVPRK